MILITNSGIFSNQNEDKIEKLINDSLIKLKFQCKVSNRYNKIGKS